MDIWFEVAMGDLETIESGQIVVKEIYARRVSIQTFTTAKLPADLTDSQVQKLATEMKRQFRIELNRLIKDAKHPDKPKKLEVPLNNVIKKH